MKQRTVASLAVLLVTACTAAETAPPEVQPKCAGLPSDIYTGGSSNQYMGAPVVVKIGENGEPPVTELRFEQDGMPVAGEWTPYDYWADAWEFTPQESLLPGTEYTWTAVTEAGCHTSPFSTLEHGLPVMNSEALAGSTFEIRRQETFVGYSFFLQPIYESAPFWLRVDALDGDVAHATLMTAVAAPVDHQDPQPQDACEATAALVGTFDGAHLRFEGDAHLLPVGLIAVGASGWGVFPPVTIDIFDWSLDLVIAPDATSAVLDHFSFTADTRTLGDYAWFSSTATTGGDGTETNFCTHAVGEVGVAGSGVCAPCPDGLEVCMAVTLTGHERPGVRLDGFLDIADGQRENHLCVDACTNGTDDDGDGATDDDPECDPSSWP